MEVCSFVISVANFQEKCLLDWGTSIQFFSGLASLSVVKWACIPINNPHHPEMTCMYKWAIHHEICSHGQNFCMTWHHLQKSAFQLGQLQSSNSCEIRLCICMCEQALYESITIHWCLFLFGPPGPCVMSPFSNSQYLFSPITSLVLCSVLKEDYRALPSLCRLDMYADSLVVFLTFSPDPWIPFYVAFTLNITAHTEDQILPCEQRGTHSLWLLSSES